VKKKNNYPKRFNGVPKATNDNGDDDRFTMLITLIMYRKGTMCMLATKGCLLKEQDITDSVAERVRQCRAFAIVGD